MVEPIRKKYISVQRGKARGYAWLLFVESLTEKDLSKLASPYGYYQKLAKGKGRDKKHRSLSFNTPYIHGQIIAWKKQGYLIEEKKEVYKCRKEVKYPIKVSTYRLNLNPLFELCDDRGVSLTMLQKKILDFLFYDPMTRTLVFEKFKNFSSEIQEQLTREQKIESLLENFKYDEAKKLKKKNINNITKKEKISDDDVITSLIKFYIQDYYSRYLYYISNLNSEFANSIRDTINKYAAGREVVELLNDYTRIKVFGLLYPKEEKFTKDDLLKDIFEKMSKLDKREKSLSFSKNGFVSEFRDFLKQRPENEGDNLPKEKNDIRIAFLKFYEYKKLHEIFPKEMDDLDIKFLRLIGIWEEIY